MRKTRVGIFVDKEWKLNMYIGLFKELLPNATVHVDSTEAYIQSDTHKIRIYHKYVPESIRGHKYDVVIDMVQDNDILNAYLIPMLNCSKFIKGDT